MRFQIPKVNVKNKQFRHVIGVGYSRFSVGYTYDWSILFGLQNGSNMRNIKNPQRRSRLDVPLMNL